VVIWCSRCDYERRAVKVRDSKLGWCNRCGCGAIYQALPPATPRIRQRRRMYEKRSGQLLLGGASSP
jgi:hypothetical protein